MIKRGLKSQDYKNYLEVNRPEKKNYVEKKINIEVDILKENHKEFIKGNRLILMYKHDIFTEEINKIALSATMILRRRQQPIDCKKDIRTWNKWKYDTQKWRYQIQKYDKIIQRWSTLMMLQEKT